MIFAARMVEWRETVFADYYRHEYDLTRHLDGPVCDAARRMFRNTPRASSTAAYLRQLQEAAWTNTGQAWGLDADTRHGLSCFFASRLWLLVRSRGAAAAFAAWLYADAGLYWCGPHRYRDRELDDMRRAHMDRWKRLLNLLYGYAEHAPRSIRPHPPPPPRDPPAGGGGGTMCAPPPRRASPDRHIITIGNGRAILLDCA
jgi:hypothetical protein